MLHKLKRLARTRMGISFHRFERWQCIGPFFYDCRIHYGFNAGLFTVGFWRDADELDMGDHRNMPFSA